MKSVALLAIFTFVFANHAQANIDNSKQIAKAVSIFKPLAQSGIEKLKVEPTSNVRQALLEVAIQKDYISDESEFSWVGKAGSAWDADSTNFGETTMKSAFEYVTSLDSDYEEQLNEPGREKEKAKVMSDIKKAKDAFKLLLNTGVKFGVVPFGAVQCGVTFAGLAILDPHTGKLYIFAKEGSGC